MADRFEYTQGGLEAPALNAVAVSPNDSTDLTNSARALYVGTGGTVKATLFGGGTVEFVNVASGTLLPIRVKRVYATVASGVVASDIVALF